MDVNFQDSDCEGFEHWANIPNYSQSPLVPPTPENLFRLGMGVELNEVNYPSMLCVGSILKVSGDYVLVHFDGWDNYWDVWYRWNSPELRPIGTCESLKCQLYTPYQGTDSTLWEQTGDWSSYLEAKNCVAAPVEAFSKLCVSEFNNTCIIQPLLVLSANKVASIAHCYVGLEGYIGRYLYERLEKIKACTMCSGSYLLGYKCVKAFTIHEELKTKAGIKGRTGSLCSLSCFDQFQERYIGFTANHKRLASRPCLPQNKINSPFHHLSLTSSRDSTVSTPQPADKPSNDNLFRVGMKLECVDINYPTMYCPVTILRVDGDEVLVNFDGWGHTWDIWLYWYSTQICPTGTTQAIGKSITAYFEHAQPFTWSQYLKKTNSIAAPKKAFSNLYACDFSDNIDAILPLRFLVVRKLLACQSRIKFGSCTRILPFQKNEKYFNVKNCYFCKTRYFLGWVAIPPFSLPCDITDPTSPIQVCSKKCLNKYRRECIGEIL